MNSSLRCFTTSNDGIARVLVNKVAIASAFNPDTEKSIGQREYTAIWDTGASMTAISGKVVSECDLKQIDVVQCSTAAGVVEKCPVYLVSLFLPNKVAFPQLRVSQANLKGADVLIGMDIINSGDFFITNFKGKTVFSFRYPSSCVVDFVKQPRFGIVQPPLQFNTQGRNDPCSCGSGKKYKYCHGKNSA